MTLQAKRTIQMISALFLTIALLYPFVFTAVKAVGPEDKAVITVQGVEEGAAVAVTAYRIVEPEYKNGTVTGYVLAEALQNQGLSIADISNPKAVEINSINSATLTDVASVSLTYSGGVYTAEVGAGMWLIKVANGESIYNPMIVSAYYDTTDPEAEPVLVPGTVNAEGYFMEDGQPIYAKKTEKVLDKNIILSGKPEKGTVAAEKDVLTFDYNMHIPVSVLPNTEVVITDTLDQGLTVDPASIKVYNGAEGAEKRELVVDTEYTLTVEDHKIVLTLTGEFTRNRENIENGRADVEVVYNAEVNESAASGFRPNKNVLNAEYVTGEGTQTANTVTNYVFTLGIDHDRGDGSVTNELLKTDPKGNNLGGAEFALYKGDEKVKSATSASGLLDFKGLKETKGINDAYILRETKAPAGYSLNKTEYRIEFSNILINDAGQLTQYTITITGPDGSADNTYQAVYNTDGSLKDFIISSHDKTVIQTKIINTTLSGLPSTGGIGTTVFTVAGLALIAASLILIMKRKNQNDSK